MKWLSCIKITFYAVIVASCTHQEGDPITIVPNTMIDEWRDFSDYLRGLESRRETPSAWDERAGKSEVISDFHNLENRLESQGVGGIDKEELRAAWKASDLVKLYGYDCDFHALVFFKENKTFKAWYW